MKHLLGEGRGGEVRGGEWSGGEGRGGEDSRVVNRTVARVTIQS